MINSSDVRKVAGYLEGWVSVAINTVLFVVKYFYGTLYNSIAIVADSIHTLSDSLTSVIVILGFWVSYRAADEEHPFGHGRAELIATLIIASMLIMVGIDFAQRSVSKLLSGEGLIFNWILIVVLTISAVIKEAMALWAMALGRRYNATSIIADAWHHRSDAIATALLAIALVFGGSLWWLDGVLGIAVSALILMTGAKLILDSSSELLGKAPSVKDVEKLKNLVTNVNPLIKDVHHIHMHRYGEHVEVTLHIKVGNKMSVQEAHEIASNVEKRIKEALGWEATVHIEPENEEESS
jgi:cation diffusion facilitator family transporter